MLTAYQEALDLVVARLARGGAIDLTFSEETHARVEELVRKEKNEGLPPEETAELNDFCQLEHLLRMAQARARVVEPLT